MNKAVLAITWGSLLVLIVSGNSIDPGNPMQLITKYSLMIMKNLENHINVSETYLEENSNFTKSVTTTLNSLSKSMQMMSRNVGIGDIPIQDFRDILNSLSRQMKEVSSEQKSAREATNLLSMKVDLVLHTLINSKERHDRRISDAGSQTIDSNILKNLESRQQESSDAINNLNRTLGHGTKQILELILESQTSNNQREEDVAGIRALLKTIKVKTDENFAILHKQLEGGPQCGGGQPGTVHKAQQPVEPSVPKNKIEQVTEPTRFTGTAKAPKIKSATSFVNINLLTDFEARILISGNPRPFVTWHNGSTCSGGPQTAITTEGRYKVSLTNMGPREYGATLQIASFRPEDANMCYFITAENSEGSVSSPVILSAKDYLQGCPGTFHKVGELCLDVIAQWSSWEHSKEICESLGGSLVQPTDLGQLFKMLDSWPTAIDAEILQKFWIGARKSHTNDWRLIDGTLLATPDDVWAITEPNDSGECLMIDIGVQKWRLWDAPCSSDRQAICQIRSD